MIEGDLKNTPEYTAKVNELNAANAAVTAQENKITGINGELETINNSLKQINDSLSFANNFTSVNFTDKTTTSATRTFWVGNHGRVSYWVISQ